jgi:hypothetical protein
MVSDRMALKLMAGCRNAVKSKAACKTDCKTGARSTTFSTMRRCSGCSDSADGGGPQTGALTCGGNRNLSLIGCSLDTLREI